MRVAHEIFGLRHGHLVSQQRLGRHHDKGLAERPEHMPAQDVEIIGRRGAVRNLDIAFRAELQIAFEARGAVFRSPSLIAVRQQKQQAVRPPPFGLCRGETLLDSDLSALGKIAELRLTETTRLKKETTRVKNK